MRSKLSVVVTVLAVSITLVSATPSAAVTSAGGRVTLQNPIRVVDTRSASGVRTTGPVGLTGLGFVYLDDALEPGTASIYPCAGAPGPDPSLVFEAHETVYTKVASSEAMCIVSSTPAFFVEEILGSVAAMPFPTGLQYVPLATPTVVFDGETPPPNPQSPLISPTTHFAIGPQPGSAQAAVLLLEALDPTDPGFASVSQCSQPSLTADVSWSNRRAVGISYAPVAQGSSDFCFHSTGSTTLRVTLLGYLQNDGPDDNSLPPTLSYPFHPEPPPGLRPTTPLRLLDTRQSTTARVAGKVAAGTVLELSLADQVADSTTAVALNVTVTEPEGDGFLTVYPCDQQLPKASNLNFVVGETVPNLVNAKLSITDTVCFFASRTTHVIADLMGTFERGGGAGAQSVTPTRLLDTRAPIGVPAVGKVGAGQTLVLQVSGRGGVPPSGVAAATMNVTVTEPSAAGFVTAYPCDRERPIASNLNFVTDQTVPNLVTVRLSAAGTVCLFTSASTHLLADVASWYSIAAAQGYHELSPQRILDTREPVGVTSIGKVRGGETLTLQVAGMGGVPSAGALAASMNVTVTEPDQAGFVTIFPCDAERPEVSNLNFASGETVPNLVTVKLSSAGTVCLYAQRTTHLVADVSGYYTEVPESLRVASLLAQS